MSNVGHCTNWHVDGSHLEEHATHAGPLGVVLLEGKMGRMEVKV